MSDSTVVFVVVDDTRSKDDEAAREKSSSLSQFRPISASVP